mgnify:CR=1 FL=1
MLISIRHVSTVTRLAGGMDAAAEDGTVESHNTHINTMSMDGTAELDIHL